MTKITQKPDGTVTFDLTLKAAAIAAEYQKVLAEAGKTVQIKGFRPGKAPLAMVEAQSDKSKLYSLVLDHLLSPAYSEVIHEHKLVPLIEPRVTPKGMEEDKDWVMAVEVATAPVVDLGSYEKYVKAAVTKHDKVHQPKADPPRADKHEPTKGQTPEQFKKEQDEHQLNVIFDALLDNAKLEVTPLLIEEETKSALSRLASQLTSLKLSVADYAKSVKKTTEELIAEYKKSAESNLKLEFILQKLIEVKSPEVTDVELATLKPQKGQESYAKYVLQKRKVLDFLTAL